MKRAMLVVEHWHGPDQVNLFRRFIWLVRSLIAVRLVLLPDAYH